MQETPVQFPGQEDPLEKGTANPLPYSGLENSMHCIVHGITESQTRLRDFHILTVHKKIQSFVRKGTQDSGLLGFIKGLVVSEAE